MSCLKHLELRASHKFSILWLTERVRGSVNGGPVFGGWRQWRASARPALGDVQSRALRAGEASIAGCRLMSDA